LKYSSSSLIWLLTVGWERLMASEAFEKLLFSMTATNIMSCHKFIGIGLAGLPLKKRQDLESRWRQYRHGA